MTTDRFWGVEWPEEVQEGFVNRVILCASIHVLAVLYESRRTGVVLVRSMLTWRKNLPE